VKQPERGRGLLSCLSPFSAIALADDQRVLVPGGEEARQLVAEGDVREIDVQVLAHLARLATEPLAPGSGVDQGAVLHDLAHELEAIALTLDGETEPRCERDPHDPLLRVVDDDRVPGNRPISQFLSHRAEHGQEALPDDQKAITRRSSHSSFLRRPRPSKPKSAKPSRTAGPTVNATMIVPIPNDPPKRMPMTVTADSILQRIHPIDHLVRRASASIRLSRGPAPKSAAIYMPLAIPRRTTEAATSITPSNVSRA
jgi:hypothetical protein